MSIDLGTFFKDSEDSLLRPIDFAELIVASLKLPRRTMLKSAALWSTNA
jgi:3-oxoacyl-[acyl-carrier protein] reductase